MAAYLKDVNWLLGDNGLCINYCIFEQLIRYLKIKSSMIMGEKIQKEIVLVITSADGSAREVIVTHADDSLLLQLSAGETYRFLRRIDSKLLPLEQVIGLRTGDDLSLQFTEDESMVLQDYFTLCAEGECVVEMALESNAEGDLSYFSLPADSVGLELGDGSQLMLAHGDMLTLMELAQGQSALTNAIQQAQSNQLALGDVLAEAGAEVATEEAAASVSSSFLSLATVAAVGGVVISGGGSGSGVGAGLTGVNYSIVVGLGPVLSDNTELTIELYRADGTLLGTSDTFNPATGTFECTDATGYSGTVIARLVDASGGVDYRDEATGARTDAPDNLLAIANVDGSGDVVISLTPLTHMAATQAGVSATTSGAVSFTQPLTEAATNGANTNVGTAFGVDDILTAPDFTLDANGISQTPDAYGIALALISAQEEMLGQTTGQVMATLSSQMTGDTFSDEAKASLVLATEEIL